MDGGISARKNNNKMKEFREAAIEFQKDYSTAIEERAAHAGFKAGFNFALKWIDVNKELPTDTRTVLVRNDNEQIRVGWYMPVYDTWIDIASVGNKAFGKVKHWRPIYNK